MDCDLMPGDVVACVRIPPLEKRRPEAYDAVLVEGALYNVREVDLAICLNGDWVPCLILAQRETSWIAENGTEGYWHHEYFRRVYRPNSDFISMLTQDIDKTIEENV